MSVNFEFHQGNQTLNIEIRGHFDFSLVSEFHNIYANVESPQNIIIDLQFTDVIDSSGLGILLYLQKHYDCDKQQIRLINCNDALNKTLTMAQFGKLFMIETR